MVVRTKTRCGNPRSAEQNLGRRGLWECRRLRYRCYGVGKPSHILLYFMETLHALASHDASRRQS